MPPPPPVAWPLGKPKPSESTCASYHADNRLGSHAGTSGGPIARADGSANHAFPSAVAAYAQVTAAIAVARRRGAATPQADRSRTSSRPPAARTGTTGPRGG